ncbi:MAG TPA: FtsX-like permease family protein [Kofleriaceae bacterium]|jgi:putative ABC transport system permease protein
MNIATYVLRNLFRRTGRTILTMIVVALTVLIFCTLRTMVAAATGGAAAAAVDRLATRDKVSFTMPLPKHYIDDLRQVPGIEKATWANWFGAKDPKKRVPFFAGLAVDQESFFDVEVDMHVPPAQLAAWKQTPNGVILGDLLAKKFELKVGDRLVIESDVYPGTWEFTVSGIYTATRKSVDRSSLLLRWDFLNNDPRTVYSKEKLGWIMSRIKDPTKGPAISQQIDAKFAQFDDQTVTVSEQQFALSFLGGFVAVLAAFSWGSLVILLIMALVLANTMAMSVRERTHEYGVMRAIGFSPRYLFGFIVGESTLVALIGGLMGVGLVEGLINHVIGPFSTENMTVVRNFFAPGWVMAVGLAAAVALGVAGGIVPALRASRLRTTDALRRLD